jgi:copper chaperone CopZ
LKKRERKLSKSYKKNSIDKQLKKLKLKSKQLSLPKRRQILKKDSSIFNLKHLKKSNKNLMIKITELICF